MRWKYGVIIILVLLLVSCSHKETLKEYSFLSLKDEQISLNTLSNNKASVFYFLAPECPLSQNYTKSINEMRQEFSNEGIGFYGVFSGKVYSEEEMNSYVSNYDIQIAGLKDSTYLLSKYFGATITPEVFVIDNLENVIYSGKIDNWIESLGVKRQVVTEFYLKDALNQFLSGNAVVVNKTEAVGCILE